MKRKLLHIASWVILLAGLLAAYYSYQLQQKNAVANNAYDLMGEDKYPEAIAEAEEAIRLMPDNALGYYVRGLARLKLIGAQAKLDDLSALASCKQDLLKAQQMTDKEIIKNFCTEFLQKIAAFEKQANSM